MSLSMKNTPRHRNTRSCKPAAMTPEELAKLLAEHGLEQQELAVIIGYSPTTVSRWANNAHPINAGAAALIREKLASLSKGDRDAGNAQ